MSHDGRLRVHVMLTSAGVLYLNKRAGDLLTAGAGRLGLRGGLPGGQGCDAAGQCLVGALGVVDVVEGVNLGLQLGQVGGQWLLVEVAEQGLVEAFVLALGGRFVGLAGDRLDAQGHHVNDELAQESAP